MVKLGLGCNLGKGEIRVRVQFGLGEIRVRLQLELR